jgi:hypothetical protein
MKNDNQKKEYFAPKMEVIDCKYESTLLSSSTFEKADDVHETVGELG